MFVILHKVIINTHAISIGITISVDEDPVTLSDLVQVVFLLEITAVGLQLNFHISIAGM